MLSCRAPTFNHIKQKLSASETATEAKCIMQRSHVEIHNSDNKGSVCELNSCPIYYCLCCFYLIFVYVLSPFRHFGSLNFSFSLLFVYWLCTFICMYSFLLVKSPWFVYLGKYLDGFECSTWRLLVWICLKLSFVCIIDNKSSFWPLSSNGYPMYLRDFQNRSAWRIAVFGVNKC